VDPRAKPADERGDVVFAHRGERSLAEAHAIRGAVVEPKHPLARVEQALAMVKERLTRAVNALETAGRWLAHEVKQ
jgi:hypothetical protein